MVSCVMSMFVAAALGQAPDQSAWLKSVPADVAVVARVKALETARDELLAMLQAMSGNAAALARPQIEQGLAMMEAQHGKPSVQHPFFILMTLPKGDSPVPGWAVLVESDSYEGVLKGISKKDDLKLKGEGVDTFDGPDGQPWHATKGKGFVAFGPDEALVKGVSKPEATLDEKVRDDIKKEFLGGDLGVYVNVAALQAQYGDQIEQGKQFFLGMLDQQGGQMDANTLEQVKTMYGAMFDSVKGGEAVAFHLDFAAAGLGLSGVVTVKGDSASAKSLAAARSGPADGLAKLPGSAMLFAYVNSTPESLKNMAKLGMSQVLGGKASPAMDKAVAMQAEAGALENYTAFADGAGGFAGLAALTFSMPKDPAKAVEAAILTNEAMKSTGQGAFKDVVITPKAETYKGFVLNQAKFTFDFDKMTPPNAPGGPENMRKLMGGDTVTSWFGTDGKALLTVTGKTADEAKAKIDAFLSGQGAIGKSPAFEAVRGKLPKDVTGLVLVSAQGLTRLIAQTAGTMMGKAPAVPEDMPKEVALFGGSLTASPAGYQFKFVLPSNVGPVIEKGLVPMIQGMGAVAQ